MKNCWTTSHVCSEISRTIYVMLCHMSCYVTHHVMSHVMSCYVTCHVRSDFEDLATELLLSLGPTCGTLSRPKLDNRVTIYYSSRVNRKHFCSSSPEPFCGSIFNEGPYKYSILLLLLLLLCHTSCHAMSHVMICHMSCYVTCHVRSHVMLCHTSYMLCVMSCLCFRARGWGCFRRKPHYMDVKIVC